MSAKNGVFFATIPRVEMKGSRGRLEKELEKAMVQRNGLPMAKPAVSPTVRWVRMSHLDSVLAHGSQAIWHGSGFKQREGPHPISSPCGSRTRGGPFGGSE